MSLVPSLHPLWPVYWHVSFSHPHEPSLQTIPQHLQPSGFPALPDQLPALFIYVHTPCVLASTQGYATQVCPQHTVSRSLISPSVQESLRTAASFSLFPFLREIGRPGSSPGSAAALFRSELVCVGGPGGGTRHRNAQHSQEVAPLCAAVRGSNSSG